MMIILIVIIIIKKERLARSAALGAGLALVVAGPLVKVLTQIKKCTNVIE